MSKFALALAVVAFLSAADASAAQESDAAVSAAEITPTRSVTATLGDRIAAAAIERTQASVRYDPSYVRISYPGGDVPADRGVCTDVVVRSLRTVGVDLQVAVHEDMRAAFNAYPKFWGAERADANIDHRRVPNLETYFRRIGAEAPATRDPDDYRPGDIVAWNLRASAGYLAHIGIVTAEKGPSGWPLVVHNIGAGPELEDVLFLWPITGVYRLADRP